MFLCTYRNHCICFTDIPDRYNNDQRGLIRHISEITPFDIEPDIYCIGLIITCQHALHRISYHADIFAIWLKCYSHLCSEYRTQNINLIGSITISEDYIRHISEITPFDIEIDIPFINLFIICQHALLTPNIVSCGYICHMTKVLCSFVFMI